MYRVQLFFQRGQAEPQLRQTFFNNCFDTVIADAEKEIARYQELFIMDDCLVYGELAEVG
jgi:hypothetical protein